MEVSAINSLGAAQEYSAPALDFSDYLNLMVSELSSQDPTDPVDNKEMIAQLSSFSQLSLLEQVSNQLLQLSSAYESQYAVQLLGKDVEMRSSSGEVLTATVSSVDTSSSAPQLTLKTSDGEFLNAVRLSQITMIR